MNNKNQEKQKAYQHHDNLPNKSERNTNSHIYHREAGVPCVYKARAEQTTTQGNTAKHQWSKSTSLPTSPWEKQRQHHMQQLMYVETGMCMAVQIDDRKRQMQNLSTCLQQFLMDCGRTQATLNNTVIQSDQEDFLMALLKMTTTAIANIGVRQSPAYISQAQGSVERFRRTLMGQIRSLKLQLENNYGIHLTSTHPIMPWLVKHAAYLLKRQTATPATCWNKEHKTPICEFKQSSTCYQQQKKHASFRPSGSVRTHQQTRTSLSSVCPNKLLKQGQSGDKPSQTSTANRWWTSLAPHRCQHQHRRVSSYYPQSTPAAESKQQLQQRHRHSKHRNYQFLETANTHPHLQYPAITHVPMATSPLSYHLRALLPIPTKAKRDVSDDIAEGRSAKQQKTPQQQTAAQRPEATQEPDTTVSNEYQQEAETEKILLEPWVTNTEGVNPEQTTEGMKQQIKSMKAQQVYTEVFLQHTDNRTAQQDHQTPMGPSTEGRHSPSTDRRKGIHRRSQRQRRHLQFNTQILRTATFVDNVASQQLES